MVELEYHQCAALCSNRRICEEQTGVFKNEKTAEEQIVGMLLGFLSSLLLLDMRYYLAIAFSFLATLILIRYMYKKIKGYTGDCCGACFIITEWVFLLTVLVIEVW